MTLDRGQRRSADPASPSGARRGWRGLFGCAALLSACLAVKLASPVAAATNMPAPPPAVPASSASNSVLPPPLPQPPTNPVSLFRALLKMSPAERRQALTSRPAAIQERILAKLNEYQAMSPGEREARLRATEVSFYLQRLPEEPATNRAHWLSQLPAEVRPLVVTRLVQWIAPPPPLPEIEPVKRYFELGPDQKIKVLDLFSEAERRQMEDTLAEFGRLPQAQRVQCLVSFAQFARLGPDERRQFLVNAERWREMSPADRQSWRRLVQQVRLQPPLPPVSVVPPLRAAPLPAVNSRAPATANNK